MTATATTRGSAHRADRRHHRSGGGGRHSCVSPRPERGDGARRVADLCGRAASVLNGRSNRTRCSTFPASSSARSQAAAGPGRVRREPAAPRGALSPRPRWTNSRTRAGRSGTLVRQLVRSWGEGFGAADDAIPPSIFIVGDRKQSIYGFRDADVALVEDAAAFIEDSGRKCDAAAGDHRQLSIGAGDPGVRQRRLHCDRRRRRRGGGATDSATTQRDRFPALDVNLVPARRRTRRRPFAARDRRRPDRSRSVGSVSPTRSSACCRARWSGTARPASTAPAVAADVAILFRSRDSHREFEIGARCGAASPPTSTRASVSSTPTKCRMPWRCCDTSTDPLSDLRASAFLRSRIVRLSDEAIARPGRHVAAAVAGQGRAAAAATFDDEDRRVFELAAVIAAGLARRVDRVPRRTARRGFCAKRRTRTRFAGFGVSRRGKT